MNAACSQGRSLGRVWCQGMLAVPKKSQPQPKGSERDCMTKVVFTNNMGITKAIHSISPRGRSDPEEVRNTSFTATPALDSLAPSKESR